MGPGTPSAMRQQFVASMSTSSSAEFCPQLTRSRSATAAGPSASMLDWPPQLQTSGRTRAKSLASLLDLSNAGGYSSAGTNVHAKQRTRQGSRSSTALLRLQGWWGDSCSSSRYANAGAKIAPARILLCSESNQAVIPAPELPSVKLGSNSEPRLLAGATATSSVCRDCQEAIFTGHARLPGHGAGGPALLKHISQKETAETELDVIADSGRLQPACQAPERARPSMQQETRDSRPAADFTDTINWEQLPPLPNSLSSPGLFYRYPMHADLQLLSHPPLLGIEDQHEVEDPWQTLDLLPGAAGGQVESPRLWTSIGHRQCMESPQNEMPATTLQPEFLKTVGMGGELPPSGQTVVGWERQAERNYKALAERNEHLALRPDLVLDNSFRPPDLWGTAMSPLATLSSTEAYADVNIADVHSYTREDAATSSPARGSLQSLVESARYLSPHRLAHRLVSGDKRLSTSQPQAVITSRGPVPASLLRQPGSITLASDIAPQETAKEGCAMLHMDAQMQAAGIGSSATIQLDKVAREFKRDRGLSAEALTREHAIVRKKKQREVQGGSRLPGTSVSRPRDLLASASYPADDTVVEKQSMVEPHHLLAPATNQAVAWKPCLVAGGRQCMLTILALLQQACAGPKPADSVTLPLPQGLLQEAVKEFVNIRSSPSTAGLQKQPSFSLQGRTSWVQNITDAHQELMEESFHSGWLQHKAVLQSISGCAPVLLNMQVMQLQRLYQRFQLQVVESLRKSMLTAKAAHSMFTYPASSNLKSSSPGSRQISRPSSTRLTEAHIKKLVKVARLGLCEGKEKKGAGALSRDMSSRKELGLSGPRGMLPIAAAQYMEAWLIEHWECPNPTKEQKLAIATACNIDKKQVENWFVNARARRWKPMTAELCKELQNEQQESTRES